MISLAVRRVNIVGMGILLTALVSTLIVGIVHGVEATRERVPFTAEKRLASDSDFVQILNPADQVKSPIMGRATDQSSFGTQLWACEPKSCGFSRIQFGTPDGDSLNPFVGSFHWQAGLRAQGMIGIRAKYSLTRSDVRDVEMPLYVLPRTEQWNYGS